MKQEGSGPYSLLYGMDKIEIKSIVNQLNKVPNINAHAKQNIPERYHFKKHYRIKNILVLADEGWYINNQLISSSSEIEKQLSK